MGKKVISFGLSEDEINKAIRELEAYKRDIQQKTERFREKVVARIAELSQSGFSGAVVDDLINNSKRIAQVNVTFGSKGDLSVVVANGEDAVWVEFGAGVYHNGASGSSPHPSGAELGFTIGSYGQGKGERSVWGYYEDGALQLTHGTPAVMPMYNAVRTVCEELSVIAKEVFG